jgi:AraC-like DNA-binding protein
LKGFSILYIIMYLYALVLIFKDGGLDIGFSSDPIFAGFFFLMHLSVVFWGIKQPETIVPESVAMDMPLFGERRDGEEAMPTGKTEQQMAEDYASLKKFMEAKKPYLATDLTLPTLAKQFGLPQRYLSRLIKQCGGKNFNRFVNEYRVKAVIEMMEDPAFNNFSILGIAYEAGFNSKSSFYSTFNEIMGVPPIEHKALNR